MKTNIKFMLALGNAKLIMVEDNCSPTFYMKTNGKSAGRKQSINKIAKLLLSNN
jgi:hypothetical protein